MIISSNKFSATNNAKAIVLAFHNYQEVHGTLPPLYTVDAAGKPLHSWRVLILPFLDKQDLYDKIKLDEAWDSEHNKQFHNAIIPAYRTKNSATDQNDNKTCNFVTIIGSPMKAKDGTSLSDIPDGTSNTAATVELKESFCWMDPTKNITVEEFSKPLDGKEVLIGGSQEGGVIVGFWDGSVRIIPNKTPTEALKAIATANGGESTAIQ
ncbi:MAG: DUF1559 domain-containing protein [Planctomycetaceae bacterium]|nr:DUF1559 domain-containing protein [Planctomycetaceae bacterium]